MRRWPLTGRGAAAALIGLACAFAAPAVGVPLLSVVAVVFLGLPLITLALLWFARPVRAVNRSVGADVIPVGDEVGVVLTAELGPRLAAACTWVDALPGAVSGASGGVFTWSPGERQHTTYAVRARVRGRHPLGPLAVTVGDPLGLARRTTSAGGTTGITIAPEVVALPPLTTSLGEAGGTLHSTSSHLGEGADNLIARAYVPGDSMRRIHWRATAHRDELMVRQEERESTPAAVVVFDRSPAQWGRDAVTPGSDPRFEAGLSAAVSIAIRLLLEGYTVAVVDADGDAYCEPLTGTEDVTGMLTTFATVRVAAHPANGAVGAGEGAGALGPVVVVTGANPPAWTAPLASRASLPVLLAVGGGPDAVALSRADGWRTASLASGGADRITAAWLDALDGGNDVDR